MATIDSSYNRVRCELADIGLIADGLYLDCIELCVSDYPCEGELGYLFEHIGKWARFGFKPGVIYLPSDQSVHTRAAGHSVLDTIRHEYAHAWWYVDSRFFRDEWFVAAFGAPYVNGDPIPFRRWRRNILRSRRYRQAVDRCRTEAGRGRVWSQSLHQSFISEYATTNAAEDFAETFMYYLKYRGSLDRFASRPAVYRKIKAVEKAVQRASRQLTWGQQKHWRIASA